VAFLDPTNLMHVFSLRRSTLQPRLFQQACRLASTSVRRVASRDRAKRSPVAVQHTRRRAPAEDEEEEAVRWFEQDVETGATRRIAGNPEELEAAELRQKIAALEQELSEYQNEESDEDMLAALEPEDRAKVEKALAARNKHETELTDGLNVSLDMPPLTVPLLKKFNTALRDAALHPNSVTRRKDLWRWYGRARYSIPALSSMIPKKAWQLIWDIQSLKSPSNPERLHHMAQLLRDMTLVDMEIMPDQSLVLVDTLLALDKNEEAVASWQYVYDSTSTPSERLLALGVRLFAQNDLVAKANTIMMQLFDRFPDHDPRIIVPLLTAHLRAGKDDMAFGCYVLMSQKLGEHMNMEDYDVVSLTFLEHNKKDYALAVFRDMMLRGPDEEVATKFLGASGQNEAYEKVFARMERLTEGTNDPEELNATALKALSALPVPWQNKFFYGSWLKKLIGMGQLEAATKVVELMYERGIEPDARHMNGLISGYFRSEIRELEDRGEQMAWKMIERRLEATYRQRCEKRGQTVEEIPSIRGTDIGVDIPAHLARPVPIGTIETFNVLALQYSIKEKWALIHHLDRMRRPAGHKMDSTFFNHVLNMAFNTYHDEKKLWQKFLSEAKHVIGGPNIETYNILWTAQLEHLNPRINQERKANSGYPTPRQLFGLMSSWYHSKDIKDRASMPPEFTPEVYTKIVSSFCLQKDFSGCLVALHGIGRMFNAFPDPELARVVLIAVANMAETEPVTLRGRRGRQQLPASAARLKATSKVMAELAQRRAESAAQNGVDISSLDVEQRNEEALNLLSEFLRLVLVKQCGSADVAEKEIAKAAVACQLPDISTGDKDCSNVVALLNLDLHLRKE
jgi:pentatricopeptide repeat protein